jgi:hypothetical protein
MTIVLWVWRRLQHLTGTAVFYVTAAATGVTAAADQLAELAPDGSEKALAWLVRVAAWLTAAAVIARSVTVVPPALRGLVPVTELGEDGPPVQVMAWPAKGGGTWSYLADQPTGTTNRTTITGTTNATGTTTVTPPPSESAGSPWPG